MGWGLNFPDLSFAARKNKEFNDFLFKCRRFEWGNIWGDFELYFVRSLGFLSRILLTTREVNSHANERMTKNMDQLHPLRFLLGNTSKNWKFCIQSVLMVMWRLQISDSVTKTTPMYARLLNPRFEGEEICSNYEDCFCYILYALKREYYKYSIYATFIFKWS